MTRTQCYGDDRTCLCIRQGENRELQSQNFGHTQNFKSRNTRLDERPNSSRIQCDFELILTYLFAGSGPRLTNKDKL
jgi:hypothetical protein